jgi:hypothetical protein
MNKAKNYRKIRNNTENYYKKIGKIFCPVFNDVVYFNSEGFNHLMYKNKSVRPQKEQSIKFKLISIAKEIIERSHLFQEYDEGLVYVVRKKFKKKTNVKALSKYWGFVGIVNNIRVKTIIRQVANGNKHFWSVIPGWGHNHYRNTKFIKNYKGDLFED